MAGEEIGFVGKAGEEGSAKALSTEPNAADGVEGEPGASGIKWNRY